MFENDFISTLALVKFWDHISRNKRKWVTVCLLSAVVLAACSVPIEQAETVPRPVQVMDVSLRTLPVEIQLTGEVRSQESTRISFPVSGRLQAVYINDNDPVGSGTVLASLDSLELETAVQAAQAQVNAAQAELANAQAGPAEEEIRQAALQVESAQAAADYAAQQLERIEALEAAGAVSQSEVDAASMEAAMAEAGAQQAREQLARLRAGARPAEIAALSALRDAASAELSLRQIQLNRTELVAEATGIVTEVFYHQGETYTAGSPFLLLRSETVVVEASVSRHEVGQLSVGDRARIYLGDRALNGTVTEISQTPDPVTRTYPVIIDLPSGNYVSGDIADIFIETGSLTGITIPMSSVLSGEPDFVYIVEDGVAVRTPVTIEGVEGVMLRVSGLENGQKLVIRGMGDLQHREPVTMTEAGEQP
jgi:multidrug efflux pump subunit AcrA (membrane-fusion protein)